jgi:hypothetical protein
MTQSLLSHPLQLKVKLQRSVGNPHFRITNPALKEVIRLKYRSRDDFEGRHFEASLILKAVCRYLRYPLSCRDVEELLPGRDLTVDRSTLTRRVLAYAAA